MICYQLKTKNRSGGVYYCGLARRSQRWPCIFPHFPHRVSYLFEMNSHSDTGWFMNFKGKKNNKNVGVNQWLFRLNPYNAMSMWNHHKCLKGFVKLKKIQKSEKNSEVGRWVKCQIKLEVFCAVCLYCACLQKKLQKWIEEWVGGIWPIICIPMLWVYGHYK